MEFPLTKLTEDVAHRRGRTAVMHNRRQNGRMELYATSSKETRCPEW